MNDYYKTKFELTPYSDIESDILSSFLAEIGYDSFERSDDTLLAYIKTELFSEKGIEDCLAMYDFNSSISYNNELIKGEDWNECWEKDVFKPIVIDNKCTIYSTWHKDVVTNTVYNIVINPRLSFGTGHHETTSMIVGEILSMNLANKKVLDMGTGTGILSILCSLRGAETIDAIEIDPVAAENAIENVKLNARTNIEVILGDATILNSKPTSFDIVIANINRNIIINDFSQYSNSLKPGGLMLLSGFYTQDVPILLNEAQKYNMELVSKKEKNDWAMIVLRKVTQSTLII